MKNTAAATTIKERAKVKTGSPQRRKLALPSNNEQSDKRRMSRAIRHSRGFHRLAIAILAMASPALAQDRTAPDLTLLVPGGPGGGWDLTARAMQSALESEGLARVKIESSPGPGGAVGLAQLLSGHRGDENTLMVGGLVMLSATTSQRLAISLLDATAIARLTGDYPILVVPASSPYKTVAEVMNSVTREAAAFPWAGGSAGSLYERLAGDLYEAAGLSRSALHYVPHSSGREVSESLLSGRTRVGLSEAAEIEPYLARGELRALAVAAPERLKSLDAPTLREAGYDVVAENWRGVFAGPGLAKAGKEKLETLIAAMVASPGWKTALARRRWTDLYLGAAPFRDFLEAEQSRWTAPPKTTQLKPLAPRTAVDPVSSPGKLALFLLVAMSAAGVASGLWSRRSRAPRQAETGTALPGPSAPPTQEPPAIGPPDPGPESLAPEPTALPPTSVRKDEVTLAFDTWKLTAAERDIAELMLQGLRYKQIAGKRGTSERTVRQQAQVILKKAGLDGRTDLAAHFLHRTSERAS
jgi:putative tricarboxylic transport membrane protein